MKTLKEFEGRSIRLTSERLKHILDHPEMANMTHSIEETLASPEKVIESTSDEIRPGFITGFISAQKLAANISALLLK